MDSSTTRVSAPKRLPLLAGLLLALLCWLLPAANASAAEASAAWKVTALATKNLRAGAPFSPDDLAPVYFLSFKNVGSAPTQGLYKITATLAPGLSLLSGEEAPKYDHDMLSCSAVEAASVTLTCTGEGLVYPGGTLDIGIPVAVSPSTVSPAISSFEVEGGGVGSSSLTVSRLIDGPEAGFEFLPEPEGVSSVITGANGQEITQAGAHPTQDSVGLNFAWPTNIPNGDLLRLPDGGVNRIEVKLPKGVAVNPNATPVKCTEIQLEEPQKIVTGGGCPPASQVGSLRIVNHQFGAPAAFFIPLYNMEAPPGIPAVLGFEVGFEGIYPHVLGKVRSESDYGLSAVVRNIPAKIGVLAFETELWGVPTSAIHDGNRSRGKCQESLGCNTPLKPEERTEVPFLTAPTSCEGPLVTSATATSYGSQNSPVEGSSTTAPITGCNQLEFKPSISSQPTTPLADSPTGLDFKLHMPQAGTAESSDGEPPLSTAYLKDTKVTLPEGMTLNPSAANGLGACSAAQIGLKTPVGQLPAHFDEVTGGCPNDSKIGTVAVDTPLLEDPLTGSVYLAKPFDNPFGSLLGIYLAVEDEKTGIVAKLPGKVESDPSTGQLTTTFTESPELPIEDVRLSLFGGTRASLKTPLACGTKTTTATLTPWTTPEGADASPTDQFQTSVTPRGGACPASEAAAPNAPSFSAGTVAPEAGAFSPFSLRLARQDGTQLITAIDTTLPEGLVGKLAGVPYCSEAAIAVAQSRGGVNQGALEQANPSCPLASEVGTVEVGAGAGVTPYYASGHAYLAGPYKGAPLSMVTIVPAVAGPFDLGVVVTRIALNVGEYSAQIHAVSDPLPTIVHGIPLDVRSIELKLNRPSFTLNPTSCEKKEIAGTVTSPSGSVAPLQNSFQVGGCKNLAFKPSLKLSLKGPTKRTGHPALKAVLTFPAKGTSANIARAQVGLPHGEFLDQSHIGTVCTQPQLKAQTCPAKSIYGRAKAWTPLLEQPLEGPVYLGVGFGHKLPDLVADLNGQIRVLVHGRVDTNKRNGLRNTFEAVPDAPVSRFVLEMKGGKKGLLVNSENICRKPQKAEAEFTAQNGKVMTLSPTIANSCKKSAKKKHGKKKKGKGGKKHGR